MITKVDLHMHSRCSVDGDYEPAALVELAKNTGLTTIAITDHNTASGVEEAVRAGRALDIEVIPAVEFDCSFQDADFHVLGYFIDHHSKKIADVEADIHEQEARGASKKIELVRKLGIELDTDEVMARSLNGFVTGELIAEIALQDSRNAENPLLLPYRAGGSRSINPNVNFFWDYIARGKPAYVPVYYMPMAKALDLIHELGGLAFLAHPGHSLHGRLSMLDDMITLGFQGLEAYSSYHTSEQSRYFAEKARNAGLVVSGGSDFHGAQKPAIQMGRYGLDSDGLAMLETIRQIRQSL